MTAPTVTRGVLAAQWERLALWRSGGEFDGRAVWRVADLLAPGLAEHLVTEWFEELEHAVRWRTEVTSPGYDYRAHEPAVRDPEVLEAAAQALVDEAIGHLIGGAR